MSRFVICQSSSYRQYFPPFYFCNSDGCIVLSAFQEDSEQLQPDLQNDPAVSSSGKNPFNSFCFFPVILSVSVAGLPEAARVDGAPAISVKSTLGSWSHVSLLETPVMKCERKAGKQTAPVNFQQVGDLLRTIRLVVWKYCYNITLNFGLVCVRI